MERIKILQLQRMVRQPSGGEEMCGSPTVQGKVRDGGLSLASAAETIASAFSWPGNNRVKPSMLGCKDLKRCPTRRSNICINEGTDNNVSSDAIIETGLAEYVGTRR